MALAAPSEAVDSSAVAKVLLVNGNLDYTELFSVILKSSRLELITAPSSSAALDIARRERPDLIVSDVVTSGIGGVRLCEALKSDAEMNQIPVLLITAMHYDDKGVIEGLKAGAADYLSAGAPPELIRKKCEQLISERREKQARREAELALKQAYANLEFRVQQRTAELKRANELLELEAAERARAETALRESEERFRRTFEEAPIGMALMGTDFKFVMVNKRLSHMLGYTEEEFCALTLAQVTDPVDLPHHVHLAEQVLTGKRLSYTLEKRYIRKNGEPIWANLTATVIRGQDGRVLYKLGMIQDMTESKQMQQQLIQSEKLNGLGQLVAGVAHELNNPLTSVIGYSQLALNACPEGRLKMQLETIQKEGERARHIVQNLLSFARQHKPGRSRTDVNDLLRACLDLRAYSQTAGNLSVRRRLEELPRVLADPHQLQQVFLNIIINAEQAITSSRDSGNLLVKTGLKRQQGDNWVEIIIADDGPGIPPEALGRVFDPFFTTKDVGQGTGLGLSISYGIVKEHGGKIRVESEYGRGASFFVELPVQASR